MTSIVCILGNYVISLVPRLPDLFKHTREKRGEPGTRNHVCNVTRRTVVESQLWSMGELCVIFGPALTTPTHLSSWTYMYVSGSRPLLSTFVEPVFVSIDFELWYLQTHLCTFFTCQILELDYRADTKQ